MPQKNLPGIFTVNIIGAGRLGKTLGFLLAEKNLAIIGGICNASVASSKEAVAFIGQGSSYLDIDSLPAADITIISTPDRLISKSCITLSKSVNIKPGSIVLHCSGVLSSDCLYAVKAKGCYTASVHPMMSFANPQTAAIKFKGVYCALEGDDEAISVIQQLFEMLGAHCYLVDKNKKALYHAAGVSASNYLVTLFHHAMTSMEDAGVDSATAKNAILHIMQGTLSNLDKVLHPKQALTGPIQRGDVDTLKQHMESLPDSQKALYAAMGRATVELSPQDESVKRAMLAVLGWGSWMGKSK